jgi:hypothetical protein
LEVGFLLAVQKAAFPLLGLPVTIAFGGACAAVLSLAVFASPLGRVRQAYAQV